MTQLLLDEVDAPSPRTSAGAVVIDWWISLQCPDSAASRAVVDEVRGLAGDGVVFRVRHFPLVSQVWAVAAAQCQVAAEQVGSGLAYANVALGLIDSVTGPGDYVDAAVTLGVDRGILEAAFQDGRFADHVASDHREGSELGVVGTPSFCVGGMLVGAGRTLEGASRIILDRVQAARA